MTQKPGVTERILEIAKRLVEIDAERDRLKRQMHQLLEEDSTHGPRLAKTAPVRPDATVHARLRDIFAEHPDRVFNAEELAELVGWSTLPTIRSTLSRMVGKDVAKCGRSALLDRGVAAAAG